MHQIGILYSTSTDGFKFIFSGHYPKSIGSLDARVKLAYQNENFTTNYFGLGNESDNSNAYSDKSYDHNRIFQQIYVGDILLEKTLGESCIFYAGPKFEMRHIHAKSEGILTDLFGSSNPIYQRSNFIGLQAGLKFDHVDDEIFARKGIRFNLESQYLEGLSDVESNKISLTSSLITYYSLDHEQNIVFSNRLSTGFNFGQKSLFYHLRQLGGQNGLRGFRNERFTGNSLLVYNADLRIQLFKSFIANSAIGIFTGFDVGRVWTNIGNSDKWHNSYGGGIWFKPFNISLMKLSYFKSVEEDGRIYLGIGFDF